MSELVKTALEDPEDYLFYYGLKTWCWNCNKTIYRYIQKGLPKESVEVECDNCGCKVNLAKGRP